MSIIDSEDIRRSENGEDEANGGDNGHDENGGGGDGGEFGDDDHDENSSPWLINEGNRLRGEADARGVREATVAAVSGAPVGDRGGTEGERETGGGGGGGGGAGGGGGGGGGGTDTPGIGSGLMLVLWIAAGYFVIRWGS